MFTAIGLMLTGIALGFALRSFQWPELLGRAISPTIMLMLFALGVAVGGNKAPLAAISCGGASTMDSTLPVITRFAGRQWVFVSIVHAMILDFSVPFWVTFFCTL